MKISTRTIAATVAVVAVLPSAPRAVAQTAISPPAPTSATGAAPLPQMPVPDSVVKQAERQAHGDFADMQRVAVGGQIQDAWNKAKKTAGVFRYELCANCTYKVRLREHMVSVIQLPKNEVIEKADIGDGTTFQVQVRAPNRLALKPSGFGVDTDLMVYGKSGTVYPFYLRADGFNSKRLPDLLVKIDGAVTVSKSPADFTALAGDANHPAGLSPLKKAALADLKAPASAPATATGDFVEKDPFNVDKLHGWGEYKLWGGGDKNQVADMKPETVFRDDRFTYIRYGKKWKALELPTAYIVVDGVDELVNTRIKGRTYIVESTSKLISLKSGKSYLCIQYVGPDQ